VKRQLEPVDESLLVAHPGFVTFPVFDAVRGALDVVSIVASTDRVEPLAERDGLRVEPVGRSLNQQ
jgi:hypothetical protein